MKFEDYVRYDALGLAELVRRREVSASELLDAAIARTEAVNPRVNAVVRRMDARARAALEAGVSGPFAGVPFLLKDLSADYAGEPTSSGSRFTANEIPDRDSETVRRFKAAGLVIFGKTNTPEYGLTPYTEPALFGATRNPWNLDRTCGGSSGGSAAAVAAGIVPMASGSDGGGSIRIPASCCGVVGYKPTRGHTPTGPDRGDSWWGFSTEHVLTRSVRDSAAALDATSGPDPGCPYFTPAPPEGFLAALREPCAPLRIAFSARPLLGQQMDVECHRGLERTARLLESLGHELVETAPPVPREEFMRHYTVLITSEIAAVQHQAEQRLGRRASACEIEPVTRAAVRIGRAVSGEQVALARAFFGELSRRIGQWFQDYDVLLTPTVSGPAIPVGSLRNQPRRKFELALINRLPLAHLLVHHPRLGQIQEPTFDWVPNTPVFNVTGQPSISLPLHWSADGLPVGMMFTARFADDARLLRLAAQLEQAQPWFDRRPALN